MEYGFCRYRRFSRNSFTIETFEHNALRRSLLDARHFRLDRLCHRQLLVIRRKTPLFLQGLGREPAKKCDESCASLFQYFPGDLALFIVSNLRQSFTNAGAGEWELSAESSAKWKALLQKVLK
jgi:hypothetical protein